MAVVLLILLTGCVDQEKVKLEEDLSACQSMVVYLTCLNENDERFCNDWLCEQYPDALPCGGG